jgi:hypothetical protein
MITLDQYVGPHAKSPDWTPERRVNAVSLLAAVNSLIAELSDSGVVFQINPATKSQVSGQTFGGFRPQSCPQGAPNSSHKQGQGVDIYDPKNAIDDALTDSILEIHGLYREAPSATNHWCHLTTRAPGSKKRTFLP